MRFVMNAAKGCLYYFELHYYVWKQLFLQFQNLFLLWLLVLSSFIYLQIFILIIPNLSLQNSVFFNSKYHLHIGSYFNISVLNIYIYIYSIYTKMSVTFILRIVFWFSTEYNSFLYLKTFQNVQVTVKFTSTIKSNLRNKAIVCTEPSVNSRLVKEGKYLRKYTFVAYEFRITDLGFITYNTVQFIS